MRRASLKRLLLIAFITYIAVVMLIAALQSKLIYFPSRGLHATPDEVGLSFEDVTLRTADGVRISGWYLPCPGSRATFLFFHGNAGNNADRLPELKTLHHLGLHVFIVDYRGYGNSEGSPGEKGTYLDADAAWTYLTQTRGFPANRIVVYGESLGGAVAIDLASRHPPGALIVQSTFTSLADVGALHYPLLPVRLVLCHAYDSVSKIRSVECPKLFIHSTNDSLVPLRMGRALFEAALNPKQFVETPGEHNTGGFMYSGQYTAKLREFIDQATPP